MSQKAGIKDIAMRAGVSTATVSRTLRNPELVSPKTKKKVMKAVNDCNYRPNQMGINLRTKRSGNIVAIIPDITNPFNAGLVKAIERKAQACGYSVLLGDTQNDVNQIKHYAGMVDSRQADGIILCSQVMPFELDNNQSPINLPPLVNANENTKVHGVHKVMLDNKGAAIIAMEYLFSLGHTRIACITGPEKTSTSGERLSGYKQALEQANIEVDETIIELGAYDIESGVAATNKLLLQKNRPTAIFCFNDEMAIGAISLLKENGYKIPDDISVMGFDDIRFAQYVSPSLTTVRQPVEEIGKASVKMLLDLIEKRPTEDDFIAFPVELIIRNSTGPVKSSS